jgi:acetyl esterase/lipase
MKPTLASAKGLFTALLLGILTVHGQMAPKVKTIFPEATVVHGNIPYAEDTLKRHLLDIYLPVHAANHLPLIIWIHGGAWMGNDKYADMGYMKNTVRGFIDSGYALASIDYRYSTDAPFPAQIRDCNQAVEWLFQHASDYGLDKERFAVIGFSAGGHLASLLALSANNHVQDFYPDGKQPAFLIKAAIDFYGPSDFLVMAGSRGGDELPKDAPNPLALLLGAPPFDRPDLAKAASPATYVDQGDPPFIIVQGEKDQSVPFTQSVLLASYLRLAGVPNELIIVPGAPHYGEMFDAEFIRKKIFSFLNLRLRN